MANKISLAEALAQGPQKRKDALFALQYPDLLTGSSEESSSFLDSLRALETGSTEYFPDEPYTQTMPYTEGKYTMEPPPVRGTNVGMAYRGAQSTMNPLIELILNWLNPSRGMAGEAIDKEIRRDELNRAIGISEHNVGQQKQLESFVDSLKYKQQPR